MWQKSEPAFREVLQELRPRFMLVLGHHLWDYLPSHGKPSQVIKGADRERTWLYPLALQRYFLK
jgi:hypothetical protein